MNPSKSYVEPANTATLSVVDPLTSELWDQLISRLPSSVFHSPRWMTVIQKTYGVPIQAYVLERNEIAVAGVPWCHISDLLGERRITLAFSDYCDVLAESPAEADLVARAMVQEGYPWVLRTLAKFTPEVVSRAALLPQTAYKWHWIELTAELSALHARLDPMERRSIRKAERAGLVIREAADKGELRAWYLLHLQLRRTKHHLLPQSYGFFENIWDAFIEKGQGFLLLAYHRDVLIAGTLFLLWKDACYYKFNASDSTYLSLRPNHLLLWQGMVKAKEMGCCLMDMGRSSAQQSGLLKFKRSFGAVEEDLYAYTIASLKKSSNHVSENRQLLHQLTELFIHDGVPNSVVEQAGTVLYRFFP